MYVDEDAVQKAEEVKILRYCTLLPKLEDIALQSLACMVARYAFASCLTPQSRVSPQRAPVMAGSASGERLP